MFAQSKHGNVTLIEWPGDISITPQIWKSMRLFKISINIENKETEAQGVK